MKLLCLCKIFKSLVSWVILKLIQSSQHLSAAKLISKHNLNSLPDIPLNALNAFSEKSLFRWWHIKTLNLVSSIPQATIHKSETGHGMGMNTHFPHLCFRSLAEPLRSTVVTVDPHVIHYWGFFSFGSVEHHIPWTPIICDFLSFLYD